MDEQEIRVLVKSKITNCECSGPGYCIRHALYKPAEAFKLCCMNRECFNSWDNCLGVGQDDECGEYRDLSEKEKEELKAKFELERAAKEKSFGFGDTLTKIIHTLHLDIVKQGCAGCNKRRMLLNRLFKYD
mgnify:CR=1 FL=1